MPRRLTFACLLVAATTAITVPISRPLAQTVGVSTDWTIEQLTASLAKTQEVDGVFHERKDMTVLDQPLLSSGFLHYRAPNFLEKQVLEPEVQIYRINGNQVLVETPEIGRREFTLDTYPGVRPLAESIRATLAGDQASLARYFHLTLSGPHEAWSLSLQPIDKQIAEKISAIVISGADDRVRRVETIETNGDRTVMDVTPLTP